MSADEALSIAYIIGRYPLLTTTFIDREITEARRQGARVHVLSLRPPDARSLSPAQEALVGSVSYVRPIGVWRLIRAHVRFLRSRPGALARAYVRLATLPHDSLRSRVKTVLHVGLGVAAADTLGAKRPDHLHAHFIDRAAVAAWVSSRLLDVPFSVTAHANDIYVSPVLLADKLAAAKFAATCTEYNRSYLLEAVGPGRADIVTIHHGIDLQSFPARRRSRSPLVLAVGQLREKKGLRHLIDAAALLADRNFDVVIAGDGPLRAELQDQVDSLGLGEKVRLLGAVSHDRVLELMQSATVFVLPAVVAADGDRDGIPNVILEAMAMELPVVATRHSGIPEAVIDGATGVLVEVGDPMALAGAIVRVLDDADGAARMGVEGRALVASRFDLERNVGQLLEKMRQ
ncbi:MAG TPA: glycosyltransferase [Acidimicrobiia bacterium]|nr:glycosyltransferase [Acidimicrobiia bacterium]